MEERKAFTISVGATAKDLENALNKRYKKGEVTQPKTLPLKEKRKLVCKDGYFLTPENKCFPCPPGCD